MNQLFKGLPPLVRGIIVLVILGIVIFIGWKVYQYFKAKAENKTNAAVVSNAQVEINNLGASPSFPLATYDGTANTIQKLLSGCETAGSERDVISEVIRIVKTPTDWFTLIVAFGNRDIADCGSFGFSSTNYDLISLLKDQLDTNQAVYSINESGYTDNGAFTDSKDILAKFLLSKGINF